MVEFTVSRLNLEKLANKYFGSLLKIKNFLKSHRATRGATRRHMATYGATPRHVAPRGAMWRHSYNLMVSAVWKSLEEIFCEQKNYEFFKKMNYVKNGKILISLGKIMEIYFDEKTLKNEEK
jgi:hypothetical protein